MLAGWWMVGLVEHNQIEISAHILMAMPRPVALKTIYPATSELHRTTQ